MLQPPQQETESPCQLFLQRASLWDRTWARPGCPELLRQSSLIPASSLTPHAQEHQSYRPLSMRKGLNVASSNQYLTTVEGREWYMW